MKKLIFFLLFFGVSCATTPPPDFGTVIRNTKNLGKQIDADIKAARKAGDDKLVVDLSKYKTGLQDAVKALEQAEKSYEDQEARWNSTWTQTRLKIADWVIEIAAILFVVFLGWVAWITRKIWLPLIGVPPIP
jgi:hypothetical protein